MNRREIVLRTALAALALGGVAAAIWAALAVSVEVAAYAPSRASDCRASEAAASTHTIRVCTGTATPGIERMAERGKSSPLKEEIREAVRAGHVGAQIRGDNLKRSPGSLEVAFQISREYPLVSLVAMLAPSPDWFVGVSALDLCEGGRWAIRRIETPPFRVGGALRAVGTMTFSRLTG